MSKQQKPALTPDALGAFAVHANPLTKEGHQGTTVQLSPVDEHSSGWGSLPIKDGRETHDLGSRIESETNALQHEETRNDLSRSDESCGEHAEGSRRKEANQSAHRIYEHEESSPDERWVEQYLSDFFDGLKNESPSHTQEPAINMEICPQGANDLAQTSEQILIVSTMTDRILRTAAFRGKKNGLLGPRGLDTAKDVFSRLLWDRGKPDQGPAEGEV